MGRPSPRLTTGVAALAILAMTVAAVVFARADQTRRVGDDAAVVAAAERALRSLDQYRAGVTIAVLATAADVGIDSITEGLAAAERDLGDATASARSMGWVDEVAELNRLAALGPDLVRLVAADDVAGADAHASTEILPTLDRVSRRLAQRSAQAEARIAAEQATAGGAARASSFVVALIAPALGFWAFRRAARRRLEQQALASELATQRELTRVQDQLISGMSHQLRTPLTGIYGFAEALLDEGAEDAPDQALVTEAGRTILGEANRLRGMVDDILVTARNRAGGLAFERQWFEPRDEVEAAIDPFRRIGLEVEVRCEPVHLSGDRLRLRHLLRNLVDNAFRHGADPVVITGVHHEGYRISVSDAGAGPLPTITQSPFAHDEETMLTAGLGLGLSVCRTICAGMGISLARRRDGERTVFELTFPPHLTRPNARVSAPDTTIITP